MRVLHTSDWHLGQKFLFNDRREEHQMALDWLRDTILSQEVDVLVVAGDIFDIANPPNYARKQYYQFLTSLLGSCCRHIVITGGNHDSPPMLNAPKELLEVLNIHIVADVSSDKSNEVLELKSPEGVLELVVAAVPFLRDRDLYQSVAGETGLERIERLKKGIADHYAEMGHLVDFYRNKDVPIITTGHLYASGAEASDKQDNIYIGNVENITGDKFPAVFDYVALGHIHRAQRIGGTNHIRYSGSLIPLSFSEVRDEKSAFLLHFEGKKLNHVETIPVPTFRRLKTIKGKLEDVEQKLQEFAKEETGALIPWVEVVVETDQIIPQLDQHLSAFTTDMNLELLKIRLLYQQKSLDEQVISPDLGDLTDLDVFRKRCERFGSTPEEQGELEKTFLELKSWMQEANEDTSVTD